MKVLSAIQLTFAAALCIGSAAAIAQATDYPNKAVKIVVPFPPGGLADTVARPVAEAMSRELGQAVVIENKGGAGGGIGMAQAAKSAPDGYTLLLALSSYSVLPEADKVLGRAPMYTYDSLRPIARFTADPTVLAVRADAPWKTVKDFVEDARRRPGAINYGSSGNYGTMHVPMEILAQQAGVKMTHIPFTGAGPAVIALLGGQVEALSTGPATVLQHVKAGKVKVLGHWGTAPLQSMPEVPSLKDAGYDATYAQWSGLFVPAGTPEPIVQKLRAAAKAAAEDEKVKQVILGAGSPVQFLDAPAFQTYVQNDVNRMTGVVQKIGKVE